jgi:CheY-like chemotaxis protein
MQWKESGGPLVRQPTATGFGTRVIMLSVTQQLGGFANFSWAPSGLHFTMSGVAADAPSEPSRFSPQPGRTVENGRPGLETLPDGQRLLLVEDEALIGMMMKDILTELGFHVIGPFSTADDATEALGLGPIEAAVLDVNLNGVPIYPLADEVARRGIPFVFVTGYGRESIDARFADIPVLQKPVDPALLERVLFPAEGKRAAARDAS